MLRSESLTQGNPKKPNKFPNFFVFAMAFSIYKHAPGRVIKPMKNTVSTMNRVPSERSSRAIQRLLSFIGSFVSLIQMHSASLPLCALVAVFAICEGGIADETQFKVPRRIPEKVAECLWPSKGESLSVVVHVLHAFRANPGYQPNGRPSLSELQELLLNGRKAEDWYGDCNFIFRTRHGAAYLYGPDLTGGQSHHDQVLSLLAEFGRGRETRVVSSQGEDLTVGDLLTDSMSRFRLDVKSECEWSAFAILTLLDPSVQSWKNKFGESITRDEVVDLLISRQSLTNVCFGCHVPQTLCSIRMNNAKSNALGKRTMGKIDSHLKDVASAVVSSQLADGAISPDWRDRLSTNEGKQSNSLERNREWSLDDRLLCTAHSLEWMWLASTAIDFTDAIARGREFLLMRLNTMQPSEIDSSLCGSSHAIRVLFLMDKSL